jgi:hypothetical protein
VSFFGKGGIPTLMNLIWAINGAKPVSVTEKQKQPLRAVNTTNKK